VIEIGAGTGILICPAGSDHRPEINSFPSLGRELLPTARGVLALALAALAMAGCGSSLVWREVPLIPGDYRSLGGGLKGRLAKTTRNVVESRIAEWEKELEEQLAFIANEEERKVDADWWKSRERIRQLDPVLMVGEAEPRTALLVTCWDFPCGPFPFGGRFQEQTYDACIPVLVAAGREIVLDVLTGSDFVDARVWQRGETQTFGILIHKRWLSFSGYASRHVMLYEVDVSEGHVKELVVVSASEFDCEDELDVSCGTDGGSISVTVTHPCGWRDEGWLLEADIRDERVKVERLGRHSLTVTMRAGTRGPVAAWRSSRAIPGLLRTALATTSGQETELP
jgi:hypothetical protein